MNTSKLGYIAIPLPIVDTDDSEKVEQAIAYLKAAIDNLLELIPTLPDTEILVDLPEKQLTAYYLAPCFYLKLGDRKIEKVTESQLKQVMANKEQDIDDFIAGFMFLKLLSFK